MYKRFANSCDNETSSIFSAPRSALDQHELHKNGWVIDPCPYLYSLYFPYPKFHVGYSIHFNPQSENLLVRPVGPAFNDNRRISHTFEASGVKFQLIHWLVVFDCHSGNQANPVHGFILINETVCMDGIFDADFQANG